MSNLLQNIFSVKNKDDRKILTFLGVKFKVKNKYIILKNKLDSIENITKDIPELQQKIDSSIDITSACRDISFANNSIIKHIDKPFLYNNQEWEGDYLRKFNSDLSNYDLQTMYRNLINNLDNDSIKTVNKIIARCKNVCNNNEQYTDVFLQDEMNKILKIRDGFWGNIFQANSNCWAYDKYYLPVNHFELCVFNDKHGIEDLNKDYFKNKEIIDAGGFIGDSAIVLSDYTTKNVHSFEPTKENYELMLKTIELNEKSNIIPINKGLSDKEEKLEIFFNGSASGILDVKNAEKKETCTITTLDKYVQENNLEVGLIKTDLEGFEQQFLKGAENTIRTQKPTLLISIYHTADDFFSIKPLIESWNLGYKFKIIKPLDGQILLETFLIAEIDSEANNI